MFGVAVYVEQCYTEVYPSIGELYRKKLIHLLRNKSVCTELLIIGTVYQELTDLASSFERKFAATLVSDYEGDSVTIN